MQVKRLRLGRRYGTNCCVKKHSLRQTNYQLGFSLSYKRTQLFMVASEYEMCSVQTTKCVYGSLKFMSTKIHKIHA